MRSRREFTVARDETNAHHDFEPETGVRLLTSGLVLPESKDKRTEISFVRNRFRTDSILSRRNINYKLNEISRKKEMQNIQNEFFLIPRETCFARVCSITIIENIES